MNDSSDLEAAIFVAARGLAAGQRPAYLEEACAGDAALRRRINDLLDADAARGGFLHELPPESGEPSSQQPEGPPSPGAAMRMALAPSEKPGDRIGRYKLLQEIGQGGCGVVYMAEQLEPVRRRVALKVIKLGMDTRQVIARFEAERQALALMDHPHIAKVLEAGATETGRPFFVMELVKGIPITRYCDENRLDLRARLGLFVQICQAIQHAHQKGIIHRDIKPSNVLVADRDGVPVPKVIDFGIAKATTDQPLTDKTLFTAFEQFIGTPAYMSPEQAKLSDLDVDTRTDLYSLGVLLYELLTGKTPLDAQRLLKAGLDEVRRVICEEEPLRPSTRLRALEVAEQTTLAKHRRCEPPKLLHLLRGDLDWIVMKTLEKDRTRRYETVNGLAMDVQRYLADEPIVARPPSKLYEFQKTVRRHKLGFLATGAVILTLVLGLAVSTRLWFGERQAHQRAVVAEANAETNEKRALAEKAAEAQLRKEAEAQELLAHRLAYASDISLAEQALAVNNLGHAQALLNRQRPKPGQPDLRGWEWRYLWSQARADEHDVFLSATNLVNHSLSFSADGRLVARGVDDKMVVTDLISRRPVLQRTNAWLPVFAHQGARLAFVVSSSTNEAVVLLDTATAMENRFESSWQETVWLGFTPDDRRLLTVSLQPAAERTNGVSCDLTAWESDTGRQLWQRPVGFGFAAWGKSLQYPHAGVISPDGAAFASTLEGGWVQVLETEHGTERFAIKVTEARANSVVFSPDSSTLLTSAGYTDSTIRLWDAHNGQAKGSLESYGDWVSDLIFTADGTKLISSSGDGTIRLWDWATRKPAGVLRGHLTLVWGLALAPDDRTLASRCKDGSIYLWDLTKPSRPRGYQTLPSHLREWAVFTPDSQSILGVERDGGVALWDARTLKETRRLWGDSTNRNHLSLSPDAKWVVAAEAGGRLRVWDVNKGAASTNFVAAPGPFGAWFTDNGKFLVTKYGPNTNMVLEAWDTDNWKRNGSTALHVKDVGGIYTPALSNSFGIQADGTLRLFDVTKLSEAPKLIKTKSLGINFWATSPDGRFGAIPDFDGFVTLWDMQRLQPLETLSAFRIASNVAAFSPDGRRLVAGSRGSEAVKLWDDETRQELLTLSGEGVIAFLKFSPDGRYLLAINTDGVAHLWFAPTLAEIDAGEKAEAATGN